MKRWSLRLPGRGGSEEHAVRLLHDGGDERPGHFVGRFRGFWIVRFPLGACRLFDPETGRGATPGMHGWALSEEDVARLRAKHPTLPEREALGGRGERHASRIPATAGQTSRVLDERTRPLPWTEVDF